MLTVSVDPVQVESQLSVGALVCPCEGVLGGWGHARARTVIGGDRVVRVRPRRGRCRRCGVTHVLLPAGMLVRRGHAVEVIGRVLELAAAAVPARRIARGLGLARSTVRGWVARFRERVEVILGHFVGWVVWLAGDLRRDTSGPSVADAVTMVMAAAEAAATVVGLDRWQFAAAATGGRLLGNTSAPFPTPWTPTTLSAR
jgi:transposase-like protein